MKIVGNREILRILRDNRDLDYIAYVITSWHALAFEAALKKIEDDVGRSMRGLIVVKAHVESGFLIDDTRFVHLNADQYYFKDDEIVINKMFEEIAGLFYYMRLKEEKENDFYVFKPNGFRYPILAQIKQGIGKKRKIAAVSIDEGIGIYLYSYKDWLRVCLAEQKSFGGKIISYLKYIELNLLDQEKLKITGHFINCELLKVNETGNYFINENMADYFAKSTEEYAHKLGIDAPKMPSRYILINTQPFDDCSVTKSDSKNLVLEKCIKIMRNEGYEVIVKPHPREENFVIYEKMGARVWNMNLVSQEALLALADHKPKYVVGFYTTTLVTSKLFFGIPTIGLGGILCENGDLTKNYQSIFYNFQSKFKDFVDVVNSYDELLTKLKTAQN